MKMKTAIFDLDGTLLNTLGDLCDSVNCAIVPRGFPAVDEELTRQRRRQRRAPSGGALHP